MAEAKPGQGHTRQLGVHINKTRTRFLNGTFSPRLVGMTIYIVMSETMDQLAFNNNPAEVRSVTVS